MINFLLRTSNRPKGFRRMCKSIFSQTYKNYNLLVTVDDYATESYVKTIASASLKYFKIKQTKRIDLNHNPYNLYNNILMDAVTSGWIMFGDDDDYIINNQAFDQINKICVDEDTVYIFRLIDLQNGKVIPSHQTFGKGIAFGDVSTQNFVFHSKYKNSARWQDKRGGDFLFLKDLINNNKDKLKICFVDLVIQAIDHRGMNGNRIDI